MRLRVSGPAGRIGTGIGLVRLAFMTDLYREAVVRRINVRTFVEPIFNDALGA
jgi:hypothetical protein